MTWTTSLLAVALIASNLAWAYYAFDQASITKYRDTVLYQRAEALEQSLALVKALAHGKTRSDVVSVAEPTSEVEHFEKDGYYWVDWYGFSFENDRVVDTVLNFQLD